VVLASWARALELRDAGLSDLRRAGGDRQVDVHGDQMRTEIRVARPCPQCTLRAIEPGLRPFAVRDDARADGLAHRAARAERHRLFGELPRTGDVPAASSKLRDLRERGAGDGRVRGTDRVVGAVRFGLRLGPGTAQRKHPGPMETADAGKPHDRALAAIPERSIGPLRRAVHISEDLARCDEPAVHEDRRARSDLATHRGSKGGVLQTKTFGDTTETDDDRTLPTGREHLGVVVSEVTGDLYRTLSGGERSIEIDTLERLRFG